MFESGMLVVSVGSIVDRANSLFRSQPRRGFQR